MISPMWGKSTVHCADSLAVLVLLHVESLDFLRIVGENYGLLEVLLHEIALVLALEVGAPVYGEFELLASIPPKNLHALAVAETHEIILDHEFQTLDEVLVDTSPGGR